MFNWSINISFIGSYYINELRDELIKESIDIGNWNKKIKKNKKGKNRIFFRYHCSPDIKAIFSLFNAK